DVKVRSGQCRLATPNRVEGDTFDPGASPLRSGQAIGGFLEWCPRRWARRQSLYRGVMPRGGTTAHEPQLPSRRPGGGLRLRFKAAQRSIAATDRWDPQIPSWAP